MFVLYVALELITFEGTFAMDALLDSSKLMSLPVYFGFIGGVCSSH